MALVSKHTVGLVGIVVRNEWLLNSESVCDGRDTSLRFTVDSISVLTVVCSLTVLKCSSVRICLHSWRWRSLSNCVCEVVWDYFIRLHVSEPSGTAGWRNV